MVEYVSFNNETYAIIIKNDYHEEGIKFFTDGDYSQQMAYMHHPKGKLIDAHVHNHELRNVIQTQEVLILKKGKLRVDFYTQEKKYWGSKIIEAGDVILLAYGGHGFEVLEEVEMIEIKQGPYLGDKDKERFLGVDCKSVKYI